MFGSIAGAVVGGLLGNKGASDANSAAAAMSKKQMDWQKMMSDTAHQREVKDLMKAGLNPRLSGTGGPGASSPSGSTAPVLDEGAATAKGASQSAQAVMDNLLGRATLANIKEQNNNLQAQSAQSLAAADLSRTQASNVAVNTALTSTSLPSANMKAKIFDSINQRLSNSAASYRSGGSLWEQMKKAPQGNLFPVLKGAMANRLGF